MQKFEHRKNNYTGLLNDIFFCIKHFLIPSLPKVFQFGRRWLLVEEAALLQSSA